MYFYHMIPCPIFGGCNFHACFYRCSLNVDSNGHYCVDSLLFTDYYMNGNRLETIEEWGNTVLLKQLYISMCI